MVAGACLAAGIAEVGGDEPSSKKAAPATGRDSQKAVRDPEEAQAFPEPK